MENADNLISLIKENSTIPLLDREKGMRFLIFSLTKIVVSFNENTDEARAKATQEIHFQVIENMFYKSPQLFDESLTEQFFRIKDNLDTGIISELPLGKSHTDIKNIIEQMLKDIRKRRKRLMFLIWLLRFVIIGLLIVILLWFIVDILSKFRVI